MIKTTNPLLVQGVAGVAQPKSRQKKKFPPYGKQFHQLRCDGLIPCSRVIVSTDWRLGAAYPRIVIPRDIPASNLIFNYLTGLSVEIVYRQTDGHLVNELVDEILAIKPGILITFNFDLAQQNFSGFPATRLIYPDSVEAIHAI